MVKSNHNSPRMGLTGALRRISHLPGFGTLKYNRCCTLVLLLIVFAVLQATRVPTASGDLELLQHPPEFTEYVGKWVGEEWYPDHCPIVHYLSGESLSGKHGLARMTACVGGGKVFYFVGDSRVRNLYYAFNGRLDPSFNSTENYELRHADLSHSFEVTPNNEQAASALPKHSLATSNKRCSSMNGHKHCVETHFVWHPELDNSIVDNKLVQMWKKTSWPDMVMFSAGLWAIKRGDPMSTIEVSIDHFTDFLERIAPNTNVVWLPLGDVSEEKLHPARAKLTNGLIEQFNIVVGARLRRDKSVRAPKQSSCVTSHGVRVVDSVTRIYKESRNKTADGLHYDVTVNRAVLNSALNLLCSGGVCCQA